ncbi:interleukin-8-like [Carassius auratus]|uniref:Interleukin-8-like n=1 Tax=Carassius auratus TaxID=7957 RepID=A0A6P6N0M2_CARAU|nr:interleukin-8-like [Carassius auratus]
MKKCTSTFVFLICMTLLSITDAMAVGPPVQQLRCQCVQMYAGKPFSPKIIQKVQMFPAGAHCKNVEIIATLKNGQTCLNPSDEWVKNILKA